jgi:hypothetical protein
VFDWHRKLDGDVMRARNESGCWISGRKLHSGEGAGSGIRGRRNFGGSGRWMCQREGGVIPSKGTRGILAAGFG